MSGPIRLKDPSTGSFANVSKEKMLILDQINKSGDKLKVDECRLEDDAKFASYSKSLQQYIKYKRKYHVDENEDGNFDGLGLFQNKKRDKIAEYRGQTNVNVKNEGEAEHSDCSDGHSDESEMDEHQRQVVTTKKFYSNIKENGFIILPDKKLMKEAMKLGMP